MYQSPRSLLVSLLLGFLLQPLAAAQWTVVEDLHGVPGITVQTVGPPQQPFPRPPPRSVEATVVRDFAASLNLMQDVQAEGENLFTLTAEQYVASIPRGYVEGEGGLVYDAAGRVFHLPHFFFNRTSALRPMPQHTAAQAEAECERHASLASVVQKYGHMFYHFLEETLPRVALLKKAGALPPGTKLLTWGQPYEYEYLALLGIPAEQVVAYDPARIYCADTLLVPTPTPRITPPREALLAAREALGVRDLPQEERRLVVYVSREGEPTRKVSNEQQLLGTIKAVFPWQEVVVFNGSAASPTEAIALFQRARVILGPHGAGLSHALFAAPGTTLVEFLFLAEPPMMFWHTAAALGLDYFLVPVPQAYWMAESMEVPVDEVVDILTAVLTTSAGPEEAPPAARPAPLACPPGSFYIRKKCAVCPAGSYAYNPASWTCRPCFQGRVAGRDGNAFCTTCPPGTYADADRRRCLACPLGTYSPLAGAWRREQCLTPEARRAQLEDASSGVQQLAKLSPLFARSMARRALIQACLQGGALAAGLSQEELCAALKLSGSFDDPYRGPYLLNSTAIICQPTLPGSPFPYALSPGPLLPEGPGVRTPPVDVPGLPPSLIPTLPPFSGPGIPSILPGTPGSKGPTIPGGTTLPGATAGEGRRAVLDGFVVVLLGVLGGLILVPAAVLSARHFWRRRRAQQQSIAARIAAAGGVGRGYENLAYQQAPAEPEAKGRGELQASLMGS